MFKLSEPKQALFLTLAEFYKFPDEDFYNELKSGALFKQIDFYIKEAGFMNCEYQWPNYFMDFQSFKQEFVRCFIGFNEASAIPVESVYKKWTNDESAQTIIAGQKGYLMGDAAVHIRYLLEKFQIIIPPQFQQKPDHLAILLELLCFFMDSIGDKEIYQFMSEHFDWLPEFYDKLKKIEANEIFLLITKILMDTIEFTLEKYRLSYIKG